MQKEKWKSLEYYVPIRPLYKISSFGRIINKFTGLELKTYIDKDGYYQISLPLETNGNGTKMKRFALHRLVAYNFVKGFVKGLTANHSDGDKSNNRSSNLEWMTLSKNVQHAYENSLNKVRLPPESKGESNGRSRINEEIVKLICERIAKQFGNRAIFSEMNSKFPVEVTKIQIVENIRKKQNWKEVSDLYFTIEKIEGKRDLVIHPV